MQDMEFTLETLPDIQLYNSVGFHTTTFDNKLEMVRASMLMCRCIFLDFQKEGRRNNEMLFLYSERLRKAEMRFNIHKRVEQLLYTAMYADTYDMNGHSFVGDVGLE